MSVPQPRPRRPSPLDAGRSPCEIVSFRLHLAPSKAPKTGRGPTREPWPVSHSRPPDPKEPAGGCTRLGQTGNRAPRVQRMAVKTSIADPVHRTS